MVDGSPKDYSSIFGDDSSFGGLPSRQPMPPLPPLPNERIKITQESAIMKPCSQPVLPARLSKTINLTQLQQQKQQHNDLTIEQNKLKSLDGDFMIQKNREQQLIDVKRSFVVQEKPVQSFQSSKENNTNNNNNNGNNVQVPAVVEPSTQMNTNTILAQVVAKLVEYQKEDHGAYAMDTLNEHYSSVFPRRQTSEQRNMNTINTNSRIINNNTHNIVDQNHNNNTNSNSSYRVCIKYHNQRDIYVVRVNHNTLKAVVNKLPIKGTYRYFFRHEDNTNEEIESEQARVPYHEKEGQRQIYCQIFPL